MLLRYYPRVVEDDVAASVRTATPASRGSRRGTYDRRLTPSERVRAQRAELLAAVRQLLSAGAALSVSSIASECGMGRNTFYEHFQTVDAALTACVDEARARLVEALERSLSVTGVATPSERARGLMSTLLAFRESHADRWLVLDKHGNEQRVKAVSDAVQRLHSVYAAAGASKVVLPTLFCSAATWAILGVVDAAARGLAPRSEAVDQGAEVLGRLLR